MPVVRTDQWAFDGTQTTTIPNCATSPTSCQPMPDVDDPAGVGPMVNTNAYPLPSVASKTMETLTTTDAFGNVTDVFDEGIVAYSATGASQQQDNPIDYHTVPELLPNQDWAWRAQDVCTGAASAPTTMCPYPGARHYHYSYNSTGPADAPGAAWLWPL